MAISRRRLLTMPPKLHAFALMAPGPPAPGPMAPCGSGPVSSLAASDARIAPRRRGRIDSGTVATGPSQRPGATPGCKLPWLSPLVA